MTNTQTTTDTRPLDEALEGLRFAMVGTHDGNEWRSRPLSLAEQEGDLLRFLVPVTADWVEALEARGSRAAVTFSDPHKNTYVTLQGDARTVADRALVEHLWNPGAAAFFDGPDDPTVRVLEVRVTDGEYWDGPSGRVGQMLSLVKAAMGGDAGSKGDVAT